MARGDPSHLSLQIPLLHPPKPTISEGLESPSWGEIDSPISRSSSRLRSERSAPHPSSSSAHSHATGAATRVRSTARYASTATTTTSRSWRGGRGGWEGGRLGASLRRRPPWGDGTRGNSALGAGATRGTSASRRWEQAMSLRVNIRPLPGGRLLLVDGRRRPPRGSNRMGPNLAVQRDGWEARAWAGIEISTKRAFRGSISVTWQARSVQIDYQGAPSLMTRNRFEKSWISAREQNKCRRCVRLESRSSLLV